MFCSSLYTPCRFGACASQSCHQCQRPLGARSETLAQPECPPGLRGAPHVSPSRPFAAVKNGAASDKSSQCLTMRTALLQINSMQGASL